MKIPNSIIPLAYEVSKEFYEGKISLKDATSKLIKDKSLNENSARDYFYNFKYLLEGKKFTRTLNADTMEYFFTHIFEDYGEKNILNCLIALREHIEYYEAQNNTTMRKMRSIHKKFADRIVEPTLITNIDQLYQNIETVEFSLTDGTEEERIESAKLIKRGTCFVAYQIENELRFAPSRFLCYQNNKIFKFASTDIDGRETNKAINSILNSKPTIDNNLEKKYLEYCEKIGIKPQPKGGAYAVTRKYWKIDIKTEFNSNADLSGEFPEGKIVERTHKARERNSKVVEMAKKNFKNKHGKLYCQVCNFDFEENYGTIGKDFIEGHHTIAVSEMPADYKTKPEEIAMLCGNCHRMVHKKRPWLTMEELSKVLKPKA